MDNSKKETAEIYLFELVERISRFYLHLNQVNRQFYADADSKVDDKLIFVQSFKDSLLNILSVCTGLMSVLMNDAPTHEDIHKCLSNIQSAFRNLNELHQNYLIHLPRPSEPIELRRFSRIIDKHVVKIDEEKGESGLHQQISIYVSEAIGDSVFKKNPLSEFQATYLAKSTIQFGLDFSNIILPLPQQSDTQSENIHHITIPRIDTHNPCRWPTMIHELGHKIIHEDFFKNQSIEADFREQLTKEQLEFLDSVLTAQSTNLRSWLTECWCDLFACVVFGPAFWFSQYSSFIFETNETDSVTYPPALFRVKLIYNILLHRFPKALFKEMKETMTGCESVLEYFDSLNDHGFVNSDDTREVFIYFREFFRKYFSKSDDEKLSFGTEILNKKLTPLIKYTQDIQESTIRDLESNLEDDLPIPSLSLEKNSLIEKPTYVQEILAAAWYFRNNKLKKNVLTHLAELYNASADNFTTCFESGILKLFTRFDQSILRSIQVSEWFDLFYQRDKESNLLEFEHDMTQAANHLSFPINQLADVDIFKLLKDGDLKVIPIMDLKEQLGSASMDLRLGTSFQLYFQNKYGLIDFSDKESLKSAEFNSNLIDLDYMESIIISPGQFILGHTMEYLKLPENIAAEIEGRSSFARLGLEIHMTAGFIDPGFEGVITLEIYNAGPNPVKLFPGVRIAQLKFIPVTKPHHPYNKRHDAKYKGLLSHHTSMQFKDYEIQKIKNALESKSF